MGKSYSESSYEFEQDLLDHDVEYLDQLTAFELRTQKPSKADMLRLLDEGKAEWTRLCDIFKYANDEERESLIKAYQLNLEEKVFKNGMKLKDYQAEGVIWLMSNYIHQRSGILADEMGLGWVF